MRQGKNESLQDCHERFKSHVAMMEEVGAAIASEGLISKVTALTGRLVMTTRDLSEAKNQAITIQFIWGTNKHHQVYLKELRNQFLNQQDISLSTLHEAYNILQRQTGDQVYTPHMTNGMSFALVGTEGKHDNNYKHQGTTLATLGLPTPSQNNQTNDTPIPGTDRRLHPTICCYQCNHLGHYASNYPTLMNDNREMGHTNLTIGTNRSASRLSFSQVDKETTRIPKMWVDQSTIKAFCNADLLDNICLAENMLDIKNNFYSLV